MDRKDLAQPAKGLLALRRLTVRQAAADTNYCTHYVGQILNRKIPPTAEFARRFSEYLDVPAEELFDDPVSA